MKRLLIFCMGCLIATSSLAMHCGDEDEEEAAIQFILNATNEDLDRVLGAGTGTPPLPPEIDAFLAMPIAQQNDILDRGLAELEAGPSTSGAGAMVEPAGAMANVKLPGPVSLDSRKPWPQGKFNELLVDAEKEFKGISRKLYFDLTTERPITLDEYKEIQPGKSKSGTGLKKQGYKLYKVTKYAAENGHRLRDITNPYTSQMDFGLYLGYAANTDPFRYELGKWAHGYW